MALYYSRDVEVDVAGDLVVNSRGDISLNDAEDSCKHAMKFMLATDFNELAADSGFGSNIGSLIGLEDMALVLERIFPLVQEGVGRQGLMSPDDVDCMAVPVAHDQVLLIVRCRGQFLQNNGEIKTDAQFSLKYLFPYKEARLTEITDD